MKGGTPIRQAALVAAALLAPTAPHPAALRWSRRGPKGRDDVFRPKTCPDGHAGRIRIDRQAEAGPFITPDNRLFGARDVVSWLCAEHGPYPLEIRFRTRLGQGCPIHSKLAAAEKRRAKKREIDREQRSLAEWARQRLRSGDVDNVIPL